MKNKNLDSNILKFCILFGTIFFIVDYYNGKDTLYRECRDKYKTLTKLYIHHLIAVFFYFGWMCNNKKILIFYIISILATTIIQYKYHSYCPITIDVHIKCGIKDIDVLRDFLYFLGLKKSSEESTFYYFVIITGFCIASYKLVN